MKLFTYVIFAIFLLLILIRCSYSSQHSVHKHTQLGLNGRKVSNQLGVPKDKYALLLLKFFNAQLSLYGYLNVGLWTTTKVSTKE